MARSNAADDRTLSSFLAAFIATGAFLLSALAIVVVSTYQPGAATVTAQAPVAVSLKEFSISPATINAGTGQVTLTITNAGTQTHNLEVKGINKKSADIPAGGTATLDLGKVEAGTYAVICVVPGTRRRA